MINKNCVPYLRDTYLAYLIQGARHSEIGEFPIIESWMVATEPPKEIIQWDRRKDVTDPLNTAISFYCSDYTFTPILNNPKKYLSKLNSYYCVIGMDASPYDNMPLVVQKSQIYLNLAITYYYGLNGIKVIPNVRIGDNRTFSSLEAYPKHTLIAIGTNGFTKKLDNRYLFADQIIKVVDTLEPSGICVYGPTSDELFNYVRLKDIPIYQYDSYMMKENAKDKANRLSEDKNYEG